jgi:hypothetical protein
MPLKAQFHFLLLAIGEILKYDDRVTPQKIQDFITEDEAFGVRVPLNDCRLALQLMDASGFIAQNHHLDDVYERIYRL